MALATVMLATIWMHQLAIVSTAILHATLVLVLFQITASLVRAMLLDLVMELVSAQADISPTLKVTANHATTLA